MSSALMSRAGVRHLPTHTHLYAAPDTRAERMRRGSALAAIVVPASRPASALNHLIDVAARLSTPLVVLCSKQAKVEQVAERMGRKPGSRGVVVGIDDGYVLPGTAFATSGPDFSAVNGGRSSDLSTKRNAGLLLARLMGWEKIVFIDDDMTVRPEDISRIVHQLDRSPIAGMKAPHFNDNSVLCHARRLAGLRQDVFLSGSALGVDCSRSDLDFFPDVYNEDWFFFGEAAATRGLPRPGVAKQEEYDPYSTDRARHEEFGDLLAEGLYSLITHAGADSFEQVVERASATYWADFIDVRRETNADVRWRLERLLDRNNPDDRTIHAAIAALDAGRDRYDGPAAITPDRCATFLELWRKDTADWRNALPEPMFSSSLPGAMESLHLKQWLPVR